MLFNSISFAIFLPIVFLLHWFVAKRNLKYQNLLLILASYFFYACWDWRFLFLLVFSTLLDYCAGFKIATVEDRKKKKFWLIVSVFINLGILGILKYYNFFVASFANALLQFGIKADIGSINVILPVGISFYTFHGLSYVIDIYNGKIKHEHDFVNYSLFVSFFPLLVAGPIERATHLLPQIVRKREFDYAKAVDGLRQILWGLFKKIVIADNCAQIANLIFNNSGQYSGSTIFVGAIFFSFQIYGDFSGYSDIALGTARLFGIELLRNFAFPYFSRDIAEFWRRWHISLSSWFRDYLYIPLGGSRGGLWMKIRNTMIIFLVSGLWHGANWTFIFWGFLNALYILPIIILKKKKYDTDIVAKGKYLPSIKELISIGGTFVLTVFAWIFFRAENMTIAINCVSEIFSRTLFTIPELPRNTVNTAFFTCVLLFVEWFGREQPYAIAKLFPKRSRTLRYVIYYCIIIAIIEMGGQEQQFIYFQF